MRFSSYNWDSLDLASNADLFSAINCHAIHLPMGEECMRSPKNDCIGAYSLRKQPTFHKVATWAPAKRCLRNKTEIRYWWHVSTQILVVLLLGWIFFQSIRSTTKIWVETRHQYGISAPVTQTSFCEGSCGDFVKRLLFLRLWRLLYTVEYHSDKLYICTVLLDISLTLRSVS